MFDLSQIPSMLRDLLGFGDPAVATPECVLDLDGDGHVLVREGYKVNRISNLTPPTKHGHRRHVFTDVDGFCRWLTRHADPVRTDVLFDGHQIVACLDPQDPEGEQVVCKVLEHPVMLAWREVCGPKLVQSTLREHLIAQRASTQRVEGLPTEEDVRVADQLAAALLKLEVARQKDLAVEVDERGVVLFQGRNERTTVSGKLPAEVQILVPVWAELPHDQVELRVLLRLQVDDQANVTFRLSMPEYKLTRYEAALSMREHIEQLLPGFVVALGEAHIMQGPLLRTTHDKLRDQAGG